MSTLNTLNISKSRITFLHFVGSKMNMNSMFCMFYALKN